jgi:signal transduction histidine kinase
MTVQLREVTEQLRRHERLSVFSRVAAGLAHDLKHPIKNIENQARLLTEMPDDPRFRETFRRTVERDFAVLDRFLGNLHDLTQAPELTRVPLDPRGLAEAAAEGVLGQATERGVELRVEVDGATPRLVGDRITLERALKNLIVNAIEVSPRGASVRITAGVSGGEVHLAVIDEGPGIPPDRLDRLFEEFSTTKRSGKGLGLGLALSSRFVRDQGGQIECESVVGRGATFRLRLPREADRAEQAA